MQLDRRVLAQVVVRRTAKRRWDDAILRDEATDVLSTLIAWRSAVDEQHVLATPTESERGGEPCRTSADDRDVVHIQVLAQMRAQCNFSMELHTRRTIPQKIARRSLPTCTACSQAVAEICSRQICLLPSSRRDLRACMAVYSQAVDNGIFVRAVTPSPPPPSSLDGSIADSLQVRAVPERSSVDVRPAWEGLQR